MDFQFSLRSLLLLTLIVAIFSAIVPPFLPYSALYILLLVSGAILLLWFWSLIIR
jgi:hypothetical protein